MTFFGVRTKAMNSVLFVGYGALNQLIAEQLAAGQWHKSAVRRNWAESPEGLCAIQADVCSPQKPTNWPEKIDYLVIALSPDARTEAAYRAVYVEGVRHVLRWLEESQQRPRRIFFASSIAVYGQVEGEWITEASPTLPLRWSGQVLLEAEELLSQSGLAVTSVRLAGIYGGKRQAFFRRVQRGWHADGCLNRFTNRIHEQDAASLVGHLLRLAAAGVELESVYIGVDDVPVEQAEVVRWLQQRLGVTSDADKVLAPSGTSKRCSNKKAKATGWQPCYVDYRSGYQALIQRLTDA